MSSWVVIRRPQCFQNETSFSALSYNIYMTMKEISEFPHDKASGLEIATVT